MIKEIFEYLTTSAQPLAKRLGYVHQTVALKSRSQRCAQSWLPHIEKCQSWTLRAIEKTNSKNKVIVLGSGLMQEIPLVPLLKNFKEVELVDMVHTKEIQKIAKEQKQIRLIEADVTGTLSQLPRLNSKPNLTLDADLVISANILSQLPLLPLQWLNKHSSHSEIELEGFAQNLLQNHIDFLLSAKGTKLLIHDFERIYLDKSGKTLRSEPSIHDYQTLRSANEKETWVWNIAPIPEISQTEAMNFKVKSQLWY